MGQRKAHFATQTAEQIRSAWQALVRPEAIRPFSNPLMLAQFCQAARRDERIVKLKKPSVEEIARLIAAEFEAFPLRITFDEFSFGVDTPLFQWL